MIIHDLEERITKMKDAIVRIPDEKIVYRDNEHRRSDFAVFILTFGRPDVITINTLLDETKKYNQDYYLICSDDDKKLDEYMEKFGDRVIVFNKDIAAKYVDTGDNLEKMNIVVYARNMTFAIARELGYQYYCELDDDYTEFRQRFYDNKEDKLASHYNVDFDRMFMAHVEFLKNTPSTVITMAQMGDYIGGAANKYAWQGYQRKVMNSFFCDVDRPFFFDGTINEDVNYYVQAGRLGILNFNLFGYTLNQRQTQAHSGGLTEHYLDGGTYLKSFYSVMFCPSSVKVGMLSHGKGARMHHRVDSKTTYPCIIDEKYKHQKYWDIHKNNDDW